MPDMQLPSSSFVAVSELIEALSDHAVNFDCSEGRMLFRQGDSPIGLFVVHSGNVEVSMQDSAGNIVMHMPAEPGSLLGLPAVIGKVPYSLSAEASRGAEVSLVPHEDFTGLMLTQPGLAINVLQVLAAEVRAARSMIVA